MGPEREGFFLRPEVRDVFIGSGDSAVAVYSPATPHFSFRATCRPLEEAAIASPHLALARPSSSSGIHDATSAASRKRIAYRNPPGRSGDYASPDFP